MRHLYFFYRLENRVADLHREKTSKLNQWDDIKAKAVTSIDRCRTKFEQEKSKASPQNPKEILERLEAIKVGNSPDRVIFH